MTRTTEQRLDAAIADVVARHACSGCGMCAMLDPGIRLRSDANGFLRPSRRSSGSTPKDAPAVFARSCPGEVVRAATAQGAMRHPTMGAYLGVWQAWASDEEMRFRGSSGGALTALNAWLVESGEVPKVVAAGADRPDARRTVPVSITTRSEALAAAGSRYAPVGVLDSDDARAGSGALTGKPCEVAALRALGAARRTPAEREPILLSFFCAGTPSAFATDALINELGIGPTVPLDEFRYRGHGWPGRFTARADEITVSTTYDDSWGRALGPATQWRCKICPDGVGESADIVAADYWHADGRGYPVFDEGAGTSALIARTPRGADLVARAAAAGVIVITPMRIEDLAAVQPLQVSRRETLLGRIAGAATAGRRSPRFRGFALLRLALGRPREIIRVARGSRSRIRHERQSA